LLQISTAALKKKKKLPLRQIDEHPKESTVYLFLSLSRFMQRIESKDISTEHIKQARTWRVHEFYDLLTQRLGSDAHDNDLVISKAPTIIGKQEVEHHQRRAGDKEGF
jgi:hypothetical protein